MPYFSFSTFDSLLSLFFTCSCRFAQVNLIEHKSREPRDAKAVLSDDPDLASAKESLRKAATKAVQRVSKA